MRCSDADTPKIYLETTVFNWYLEHDRAEQVNVARLFDAIRDGLFRAYTSGVAVRELQAAPEPKRSRMLELAYMPSIISLDDTDESDALSDAYISAGAIPAKYPLDAEQAAIAAVGGIEYIVTYNMKHLNNDRSRLMINAINRRMGYNSVIICTAKEVLDHGA